MLGGGSDGHRDRSAITVALGVDADERRLGIPLLDRVGDVAYEPLVDEGVARVSGEGHGDQDERDAPGEEAQADLTLGELADVVRDEPGHEHDDRCREDDRDQVGSVQQQRSTRSGAIPDFEGDADGGEGRDECHGDRDPGKR